MAGKFRGTLSTKWSGRGAGGRRGSAGIARSTFRRFRPSAFRMNVKRSARVGKVFSFSMDQFKSYFFKVEDWGQILEPAEYNLLWRIGMDLMEAGRSMIRRRKNPSRKDRSPTSWGPSHKLKKSIFYGLDRKNMVVFAGPIKFAGQTSSKPLSQPTIPAILQFGGRIWHAYGMPADPPRTRQAMPGRRVVRIAPRPYMDKAYEKKRKKIERMTQNMIGKSPAAVLIAKNKARTRSGVRPLGD